MSHTLSDIIINILFCCFMFYFTIFGSAELGNVSKMPEIEILLVFLVFLVNDG